MTGNDEFSELADTFNGLLGRLETAFMEQQRVLEQQRRFTADASHELKTPLTIIKGNTSMALEEIALFDLQARLARLLLKLSEDYGRPLPNGGGIRIELKLSQRDLATLVASSRETVNKQLRGWREQGWVEQIAGYLVVKNAAALLRMFG